MLHCNGTVSDFVSKIPSKNTFNSFIYLEL
jgi:hypothetical protein